MSIAKPQSTDVKHATGRMGPQANSASDDSTWRMSKETGSVQSCKKSRITACTFGPRLVESIWMLLSW